MNKNWFNQWKEKEYYILDTETTGLNGELVEIAIVDNQGEVVFHELLKPTIPMSKENVAFHGITNEMVNSAKKFDEIYDELKKILSGKPVLIYHAAFDSKIINNTCELYKLKAIKFESYCVMEEYKKIKRLRKAKLETAVGHKIEHRAIGDCLAVKELIEMYW